MIWGITGIDITILNVFFILMMLGVGWIIIELYRAKQMPDNF